MCWASVPLEYWAPSAPGKREETSPAMSLKMGVFCMAVLLPVACAADDGGAGELAAETCTAVEGADANPASYMLEGFQKAEAAGLSEAGLRSALVEECGLEPPDRATLERLGSASPHP